MKRGDMMYDFLVKNVRTPYEKKLFDVGCLHGEIKKIGKIDDSAETVIEGEEHVILPPFVLPGVYREVALEGWFYLTLMVEISIY